MPLPFCLIRLSRSRGWALDGQKIKIKSILARDSWLNFPLFAVKVTLGRLMDLKADLDEKGVTPFNYLQNVISLIASKAFHSI